MKNNNVEELCRGLVPVIGKEQADTLWISWLAEDDWKSRQEIEQLIEILSVRALGRSVTDDKIMLAPPSMKSASGTYYLGNIVYNNKELYPLNLREEDFIKQIGIFAITGEGKSNVAMLIALQLIKRGIPVMMLDWKRGLRALFSLSHEKYPYLAGMKIYTIGRATSPFLWNPLRPPPGIHWKTWIGVVAEILEKSHLGGLGVADFFSKIYEKKFTEFGFNGNNEKDFYPNFFDGKAEIAKMKASARELLWKQSAMRIFRNFTFGPAAKSFNARNPVRLEELLDKPVILELDQELPKPLRVFFTELILKWIHLYRLGQGETESLRHVLVLEEIHNLFPKSRFEKETFSSLENIFKEIRATGQGLISISQHPSLLPVYILGNCHTQITLGLQHEDDIHASGKSLFLPYGKEGYLDKLKVGEGIVKIKGRIEPCLVRFPLVPVRKGIITDEMIKEKMTGYFSEKQTSQGFSKEVTDISKPDKGITNGVKHLLLDILKYPLSGVVKRYIRLGINRRRGNAYRQYLMENGFIQAKEILLKNGRITLFEITPKAMSFLNQDTVEYNEGIEHRFWKWKISQYYKKQGYKVEIEKRVNGQPDILVKKGNETIALEIETGSSDALSNIEKGIKSGFDMVISVATNERAERAIREQLKRQNLDNDARIRLVSVRGFDYN